MLRSGDAVLARTNLGRPHRVLLAGHIDTVPIADNVPSRRADGIVHGCGTSDMKSGDAVFAHLAATLAAPRHDLTLIFYDCEEIEAERNGLGRIEREHRDWLDADLAILGEPTDGALEAGCQGTLRVELRTAGRRSHSARSWLGTTRSTGPRRSCRGWRPTGRGGWTSTAASTARGCRRCGSAAGSRATSSPTSASSR